MPDQLNDFPLSILTVPWDISKATHKSAQETTGIQLMFYP